MFTSCQKGDDLPAKLRAAILKINAREDVGDVNNIYLIIPTTGCDKCISEATKFFFEDIKRKDSRTRFVFTEISSMKIFRLQMGFPKKMEDDRILLDENNEMYRSGVRTIYPLIFIPSEDGVITIDMNNYQSLLKLGMLHK
ncbi:hypothetical protein [Dawidia soli]|uniref:Uncharacterized protein n=1 Tax=Dawidia soli TaxID=2782352 RepID=A0AAP2DDN2_9BACT|nr:hypothetical protein [Dawidia soli]MBT1689833.1 hypothetical protein [Dawidia soli]